MCSADKLSAMILKLIRMNRTSTLPFIVAFMLTSFTPASNADETSAFGLTNFSFASYLGTGFYTTSGQEVFVLQLPFEHVIRARADTTAGIVLKLPITVGLINFDNVDVGNLPQLNDVATMTFLPGMEYRYPVTPDWTVIPFADYGFARDFNNSTNVLVTGIGIKSYYDYHLDRSAITLGNRFLYARERSKASSNDSDYSLIETGLKYTAISDYDTDNGKIKSHLYYINFYYPNNLIFLERTKNPIRVGVENEIGITFSNLPDIWFFEKPEIGIGVRISNEVKVYRVVFGAPF